VQSRARNASFSDVCKHLAVGAGLGAVLALALIVGNKMVFSAVSNSTQPRPDVILLLYCIAFVGVGSAISGFVLTSLEKNQQ